jgi:hypothetical protein
MGCGSSSLKGDAPGADLGEQPMPAKKVEAKKSQFNTVDYERGKDPAKASVVVDRAPHETDLDYAARSGSGAKDPKLEPYKTTGDEPTDAAGGTSAGEGMAKQEAKDEVTREGISGTTGEPIVAEGQTATDGVAANGQEEADGVIR